MSFYRSMGAEVTVVEALERVAPLEDEDVSKEVVRAFRRRGSSLPGRILVCNNHQHPEPDVGDYAAELTDLPGHQRVSRAANAA